MNLLSHYFLDHHTPSQYYKLGVLIPDLIYQFNRKVRKQIVRNGIPHDAEHKELFEGIKRHYEVDGIFHQSDFFNHYTKLLNARIKELPLPSVKFRSYFLAHIFLEMLLDRVLAKHNPLIPVKIYNDLKSVDTRVVESYFSRIGSIEVFTEFFNNFNRVQNARHLHFLADNEMFVLALLRVYQTINPAYPSREETKILIALTEEIETEHRLKLLDIFEVMNGRPVYA